MKNITINALNHTIVINKTFSKAASKFGSPEYQELQAARRDNPGFRVITIAKKTARHEFKGLTYEYMKKYIVAHDDENKSKMATFLMLRGLDENGLATEAASADYSAIRDWFLDTFPAIRDFHENRNALLKKVAEKKEAQRLAAKAA